MTYCGINQDADRGVYMQDQVKQVEHSIVSQLRDLPFCDTDVLGKLFHLLWLDLLDYTWATAITKLTFIGLLWSHSLIVYINIFKLTKVFKNNWILHIPHVFWPLSPFNTAFGKFSNSKVYLQLIIPSY